MSQGIVKAKPRPATAESGAVAGSVEVTIVDSVDARKGVVAGNSLLFPDPGFAVEVNQKVKININSATTCDVTEIITAQPKHHGHGVPVPPGEDAQ